MSISLQHLIFQLTVQKLSTMSTNAYTVTMKSLTIEFADSVKQSFVVSTLSLSLYLFIMAVCNASFIPAADLGIVWPTDMPISFSELMTIPIRRKSFHKVPNTAFQLVSFSTIDVILASGTVLVGFILASLWKNKAKFLGTLKDRKPKIAHFDKLEIFNGVRRDKERLVELESQCQSKLSRIRELEHQLATARNDINSQQARIDRLQQQVEGQRNHIRTSENSLAKAKKSSTKTEADLTTRILQLQSQLNTANSSRDDLVQEIVDLRIVNSQLETTASTSANIQDSSTRVSAPHFATPFVLVLIDGDAYKWSLGHFKPEIASPGAHAAEAIKREVQQYILNQKDNIPPQCRIVTRVFYNANGTGPIEDRTGPAAKRKLSEFARAFTESGPLFDYFDCGRGKERADSKMQGISRRLANEFILTIMAETVHLFVSNPYCHAIFFAGASDNGFARLLEQYAYNESAKKKIILIHPGHVAREIAELGFTAVEWPKVFAHYVDSLALSKAKREATVREQEKRMMVQYATEAVFKGAFGLGKFGLKSPNVMYGLRTDSMAPETGKKTFRDEGVIEDID